MTTITTPTQPDVRNKTIELTRTITTNVSYTFTYTEFRLMDQVKNLTKGQKIQMWKDMIDETGGTEDGDDWNQDLDDEEAWGDVEDIAESLVRTQLNKAVPNQ